MKQDGEAALREYLKSSTGAFFQNRFGMVLLKKLSRKFKAKVILIRLIY
ncbi:MAG TPA: hypothetical protein VK882_00830 [Nitrososphaeraceae archaeon]|nr:hypothetical protein [Nitrososphaeraceae archaeon]